VGGDDRAACQAVPPRQGTPQTTKEATRAWPGRRACGLPNNRSSERGQRPRPRGGKTNHTACVAKRPRSPWSGRFVGLLREKRSHRDRGWRAPTCRCRCASARTYPPPGNPSRRGPGTVCGAGARPSRVPVCPPRGLAGPQHAGRGRAGAIASGEGRTTKEKRREGKTKSILSRSNRTETNPRSAAAKRRRNMPEPTVFVSLFCWFHLL